MLSRLQAPRPAFHRNSLPPAVRVLTGRGCVFKRKAHVVGNEKIQTSIAVVVHEGASGSKPWLLAPQPGRFGHIGESAVAIVAVKRVLSKIREKNIVKAVVVVISDAHSGGPAERPQACFIGHVRKCAVAIVLVQAIGSALGSPSEARPG